MLERGLALHDRLATKDLRPFHSKMETCFSDMKTRISGEKTKPKEPRVIQNRHEDTPTGEKIKLREQQVHKNKKNRKIYFYKMQARCKDQFLGRV